MPHCMKHFSYIAFFVICITLTSCLDKAVSTPELRVSNVLVRTTHAGVQDTVRLSDSLNIGDTLRLGMLLHGGFNYLVSFAVLTDTSAVSVALEADSVLQTLLAAGTDLDVAKMNFIPEKVVACTPKLRFVPRKSGSHLMSFVITSDAGEGYSPRTYTYEPLVR